LSPKVWGSVWLGPSHQQAHQQEQNLRLWRSGLDLSNNTTNISCLPVWEINLQIWHYFEPKIWGSDMNEDHYIGRHKIHGFRVVV
jgi:hypothetical protein